MGGPSTPPVTDTLCRTSTSMAATVATLIGRSATTVQARVTAGQELGSCRGRAVRASAPRRLSV